MELRVYQLLVFIARQILGIRATSNTILEGIATLMTDQDKLDADVQALGTAITGVEAEIAALKQVPAGQPLDFTGLDAAVAKLQGDAPTPPAAA